MYYLVLFGILLLAIHGVTRTSFYPRCLPSPSEEQYVVNFTCRLLCVELHQSKYTVC